MPRHVPTATHEARLKLGKWDNLRAHVLDDKRRVLSHDCVAYILQAKSPTQVQTSIIRWSQHPTLRNNLNAEEKLDLCAPIKFINKAGKTEYGLESETFVAACKFILRARRLGLLKTADEVVFAQESDSLLISLANVGLTALIDEATGFQRERAPDALRELLDRYLKKEYAIWAKRFPDEFYHEMFRLKKWDWKGMAINRPSIVGTYTRDIVYARIAPGLLRELEVLNPKDGSGSRMSKHHQWLTDDIGHPALSHHIHAVIGLMRASTTWAGFNQLLKRAFPRKGDQLDLLDLQDSDLT